MSSQNQNIVKKDCFNFTFFNEKNLDSSVSNYADQNHTNQSSREYIFKTSNKPTNTRNQDETPSTYSVVSNINDKICEIKLPHYDSFENVKDPV